jgi:phenylpyruvate tautomerase PptA (4-oxalocrotonate tautomerase family)
MTVITVNAPAGRFTTDQRRTLAQTLTDAVLVPEVGQFEPAARVGFQVHFRDYQPDQIALGGLLVTDFPEAPDVMVIDLAVMDADWGQEVREVVITRLLRAMADACDLPDPQPAWWVTFRVIDEGSWGAGGGVLSVLSLLDSGVFTPERSDAIRHALAIS